MLPSWNPVLDTHLTCEQQQRLAVARVGIVGAGGLGSNCAFMLARSGIGHLVIADHDVVAMSNLNRQNYWPEQVGQPKVMALQSQLLALRPTMTVHVVQRCLTGPLACELFADCSIVVEAVDNPHAKRELVEALLEAGHQVVAASGMGGWGGSMERKHLGPRLTVVGDFTREVGPNAPPMAPRVMMAAALEADEVLCRLLNLPI